METNKANIPAVILAAGKGTRLRPLTYDHPKPLLYLGNKRILEIILLNLIKAGIRHFLVITGYKGKEIEKWIQEEFVVRIYRDYEKEYNIDIGPLVFSLIRQEDINGTGGAALLVEEHILKNGYEFFLLTYADIVVSSTIYKRLIQSYQQCNNDVFLVANPTDDPSKGAAVYYDSNIVRNIIEKPKLDAPKTDMENSGIYIFSNKIFDRLRETKPSERGEIEITAPVKNMCDENIPIRLVKMGEDEFWCDVGTLNIYKDLNNNQSWKRKVL
ncbi:MAG: NTP transferase domain-containing protein [Candidatus Lokiarchaeota archaeon]|nr:NTP transferase domain-containing protein [Candidatus Lokiarchaeota archaeon]